MASRNPNQRFSRPKPLASPRTKPLEMTSRSAGDANRSGLSVHRGVQGKISSSTPKVAHKVTNSNARTRSSQIRGLLEGEPGWAACTATPAEWVSRDTTDGFSSDVGTEAEAGAEAIAGGMVFGSAVTPRSHGSRASRMDSVASDYSTA